MIVGAAPPSLVLVPLGNALSLTAATESKELLKPANLMVLVATNVRGTVIVEEDEENPDTNLDAVVNAAIFVGVVEVPASIVTAFRASRVLICIDNAVTGCDLTQ